MGFWQLPTHLLPILICFGRFLICSIILLFMWSSIVFVSAFVLILISILFRELRFAWMNDARIYKTGVNWSFSPLHHKHTRTQHSCRSLCLSRRVVDACHLQQVFWLLATSKLLGRQNRVQYEWVVNWSVLKYMRVSQHVSYQIWMVNSRQLR